MPRPKSKDELITLSESNYRKLVDYIDNLTPEMQVATFPEGTGNRNIRDVLTHLHHWHLMMIDWYTVGMRGDKPDMPAKGYTWRTTGDLNKWIRAHYQSTDLVGAKTLLDKSHKDVCVLITAHSDEELFEKKRYHWTGSTSLGAYLISATSSHYDWALKAIKKAMRAR